MSVIVENPISKKKELYMKGADSTMLERCSDKEKYRC